MAVRERCFWIVLAVSALGFTVATRAAPQAYRHHGIVIEMARQTPVYAEVVAYASNERTTARSDCPTYEGFILGTTSVQSDGSFVLPIPADVPGYVATFCADGYFPRVEPNLLNDADGTGVIPFPIKLTTRNPDFEPYRNAIASETRSFLRTIVYLRAAAPGLLPDAIGSLAGDDTVPPLERAVYETLARVLQQ